MRQNYYCPNCGARVVCGERFCIGCGIKFTWVIEPSQSQATPAWYGNQYPGQQSYQEWPMYDQQAGVDRQPGQNCISLSQMENSSGGKAVAPISAEISKLLAEFERHIKYKKVS